MRIVASLAGTGHARRAVTALPALIQLRHEFVPASAGGRLVAGVVGAAAGALVVGYFVDMVMPAPRFDAAVPRGLLAVVAAGGLGGSIGHLVMAEGTQFDSARATFAGAAVGALAGFFAVAAAFVHHSGVPGDRHGGRAGPPHSASVRCARAQRGAPGCAGRAGGIPALSRHPRLRAGA